MEKDTKQVYRYSNFDENRVDTETLDYDFDSIEKRVAKYGIHSIDSYVKNIRMASEELEEAISVEHRSNNPKRDFVFVNKYQGKHYPSDVEDTIWLYNLLLNRVNDKLSQYKKVLVIGFAETATAVSRYIAANMPNCFWYIPTTREDIPGLEVALSFQEEHSHAVDQVIYGNSDKLQEKLTEADYVLFIDDEISTGKTILNFRYALENNFETSVRYGVASFCNWQSYDRKKAFWDLGMDRIALITGELIDTQAKMPWSICFDCDSAPNEVGEYNYYGYTPAKYTIRDNMLIHSRTGCNPHENLTNLINGIYNVTKSLDDWKITNRNVLVIGTEEFMYIPLMMAAKLTKLGYEVKFQATTRSPIDADDKSDESLIKNKNYLASAYDKTRKTYLYGLSHDYDKIIVITDSKDNEEFIRSLMDCMDSREIDKEDLIIVEVV